MFDEYKLDWLLLILSLFAIAKVCIWLEDYYRTKNKKSKVLDYLTTDGKAPAPYSNMTDSDLYLFECELGGNTWENSTDWCNYINYRKENPTKFYSDWKLEVSK